MQHQPPQVDILNSMAIPGLGFGDSSLDNSVDDLLRSIDLLLPLRADDAALFALPSPFQCDNHKPTHSDHTSQPPPIQAVLHDDATDLFWEEKPIVPPLDGTSSADFVADVVNPDVSLSTHRPSVAKSSPMPSIAGHFDSGYASQDATYRQSNCIPKSPDLSVDQFDHFAKTGLWTPPHQSGDLIVNQAVEKFDVHSETYENPLAYQKADAGVGAFVDQGAMGIPTPPLSAGFSSPKLGKRLRSFDDDDYNHQFRPSKRPAFHTDFLPQVPTPYTPFHRLANPGVPSTPFYHSAHMQNQLWTSGYPSHMYQLSPEHIVGTSQPPPMSVRPDVHGDFGFPPVERTPYVNEEEQATAPDSDLVKWLVSGSTPSNQMSTLLLPPTSYEGTASHPRREVEQVASTSHHHMSLEDCNYMGHAEEYSVSPQGRAPAGAQPHPQLGSMKSEQEESPSLHGVHRNQNQGKAERKQKPYTVAAKRSDPCPVCHKTFNRNHDLDRHVTSVTDAAHAEYRIMADISSPAWPCPYGCKRKPHHRRDAMLRHVHDVHGVEAEGEDF